VGNSTRGCIGASAHSFSYRAAAYHWSTDQPKCVLKTGSGQMHEDGLCSSDAFLYAFFVCYLEVRLGIKRVVFGISGTTNNSNRAPPRRAFRVRQEAIEIWRVLSYGDACFSRTMTVTWRYLLPSGSHVTPRTARAEAPLRLGWFASLGSNAL